MNRTFSERKPKKFDAKNIENETIIRALYMYGRVPEQWELLNEIERLNNIINEINSIVEYWGYDKEHNDISSFRMAMKNIKDVLGSDK